jgi:endonuclease III
MPSLADEYNKYIPGLMKLINDRATADAIDAYVKRIEHELGYIGISERRSATVAAICQLISSSEQSDTTTR